VLPVRPTLAAEAHPQSEADVLAERRALYDSVAAITGVPWYVLAAIDQYDRTLRRTRKDEAVERAFIDIHYSRRDWAGPTNPDPDDDVPFSIRWFRGAGQDGDGDGRADIRSDLDVLYTRAQFVRAHGTSEEDLKQGLWEFYRNPRSVQRVMQFAKLYRRFDTLNLDANHAFPLPLRSDYSYRSTWGARRSYGGYRIHEGTDIFAGYGVPVRSTCYGVVETKGWNRFGGWRIGIRDINNVYHYFAHLSGFDRNLQVGDIVEPGQVVAWVGSSGYGKPGTQGKFPPHLHFGLYRDGGLRDWSFDPYPLLKRWEREEAARRKNK
jgi:murein DD-endopeptidase MepM/ murein hydrolase activator NlpD